MRFVLLLFFTLGITLGSYGQQDPIALKEVTVKKRIVKKESQKRLALSIAIK